MKLFASSRSQLAIVITAREPALPRWIRDLASGLRADGHLVRVILPSAPNHAASLLWDQPSRFLSFSWHYRLYHRLERRAGSLSVDLAACDPGAEEAESLLPGEVLSCDLLIDLAMGGSPLVANPRLGVLRVEFGLGRSVNERLLSLATEAALPCRAILVGRDGSRSVLGEAWAPAHPFSLDRGLNRCKARVSPLLRKKVGLLASSGVIPQRRREDSLPERPLVLDGDARHYLQPIAKRLLKRTLASMLTRAVDKLLYRQQWALVLSRGEARSQQQVIVPPADRFWADPFPYARDGELWLFFEEQLFRTPFARLSCAKVGADGHLGEVSPILELPYHLSYPYLVEREGELYMIPESHQNKTIDLYRCVDFPTGWEKVATLIEGLECADTSVVQRADGWWLFTSTRSAGSSLSEELYVFHAEDLLSGVWTPHEANPIVTDVRSSRCAGRIYEMDGRLFRPSQDCAAGYGKAVVINEIVELDERNFREVARAAIPASSIRGLVTLHTFNAHGDAVVVDGQLRRSRFRVDLATWLRRFGHHPAARSRISRGADISLLRRIAAGYYD